MICVQIGIPDQKEGISPSPSLLHERVGATCQPRWSCQKAFDKHKHKFITLVTFSWKDLTAKFFSVQGTVMVQHGWGRQWRGSGAGTSCSGPFPLEVARGAGPGMVTRAGEAEAGKRPGWVWGCQ